MLIHVFQENVEDTKGVIRISKSKNRQYNGQKDKKDLQTTTKKIKIEQHEPHFKPWVNSCVPGGYAVPASLVTSLNDMKIMLWKSGGCYYLF